jgi:hypothetical protein
MGETGHGIPAENAVPGPGYEVQDANPRAVLWFLAGLFIVICLTMFATWLMFRRFSVSEVAPPSASSFADVREVPAGPQLQPDPRTNLLETRSKQQQELDSYSWEDRKAGIVRIPIERAMDLLLQKGLPVLPNAAQEGTAPAKMAAAPRPTTGADAANGKGPTGND